MVLNSILLVLGVLVASAHFTSSLSYPVCDTIGEEFTTDSSRLTGTWPFYNLLFTCSGTLNLEGYSVDACVGNGTRCGQPAADAFCQYLGFDKNSPGLYSVTKASAPAFSLTGEWCVSPGQYANLGHPNRTEFEAIKAQNAGPYCSVLDSVTCVRSRNTLAIEIQPIQFSASLAPATAPAAGSTPGAAYVLANSNTATAGRKMKGLVQASV